MKKVLQESNLALLGSVTCVNLSLNKAAWKFNECASFSVELAHHVQMNLHHQIRSKVK